MENKNFNDEFSSKSIRDLIATLRGLKIAGYQSNQSSEKFRALIKYLSKRELSTEEKVRFENILNSEREVLKNDIQNSEQEALIEDMQESNVQHITDHKYPALRTIAGIFAAFAWIVGLASLVAAIFFFSKGETGIVIALPIIIGGAITVLMLAAAAELIKLFIDIEHNTRKTAKNTLSKL